MGKFCECCHAFSEINPKDLVYPRYSLVYQVILLNNRINIRGTKFLFAIAPFNILTTPFLMLCLLWLHLEVNMPIR